MDVANQCSNQKPMHICHQREEASSANKVEECGHCGVRGCRAVAEADSDSRLSLVGWRVEIAPTPL